jgi:transposase
MHIASIGIDLGKTTFHLVALDEHGKIVGKKKFSRKQLAYTANLQSALIGIEACSGAHFIGAALRNLARPRSPCGEVGRTPRPP